MNDELREFVDEMDESYTDVNTVSVRDNGNIIALHQTSDVGISGHVTRRMLDFGYVVHHSIGSGIVFRKIESEITFAE